MDLWGFQVAPVIKNLPVKAEDIRHTGSIPGLGTTPGGGSNPPVFLPVRIPMDRGPGRATVYKLQKLDKTEVT